MLIHLFWGLLKAMEFHNLWERRQPFVSQNCQKISKFSAKYKKILHPYITDQTTNPFKIHHKNSLAPKLTIWDFCTVFVPCWIRPKTMENIVLGLVYSQKSKFSFNYRTSNRHWMDRTFSILIIGKNFSKIEKEYKNTNKFLWTTAKSTKVFTMNTKMISKFP